MKFSAARIPVTMLAMTLTTILLAAPVQAEDKADEEGWITMFDGESLKGWKANERPDNWKVENGAIVAAGERSHLFYVGDDENKAPQFESFRWKADVMTTPGSNSGMYFHTNWDEEKKHARFPQTGFEAQVNNSHRDPVRTGSIYHLVKNFKAPAKDNEWFTQEIVVDAKKKNIKTYVNGQLIADYTEPEGKTGDLEVIKSGTFAFQAHDPKSTTHYKNIKVKPLD
ncbi:MAG: DUF1080 domain-containing protein [Pirellulales bacterium]